MIRASLVGRLLVLLLAFLVLAPALLVGRRLGRRGAERVPCLFHRLVLRVFGIRVRVVGEPPLASHPSLILANHVSWLDIPVMGSLAPLSFVAKSEIAGWPVVGFLATLQRCIFLDRVRKAATAEVNHVIAERLGRGDAVVLFPEGTTGDGVRLLPFRSSLVGAARAALAGPDLDRIWLQPLAIRYERRRGLPVGLREMPEVAWYGDMELAPHVLGFIRGGPLDVVVVWGEPIPFDRASDRKRAAAVAEAAVMAALQAVRYASPVLAGPKGLNSPGSKLGSASG